MGKNHENAEKSRPLISLRTIFGVLFFLLMIGTILLSFLVNTLFLERYYLEDRKRALVGVYDELQKASVLQLLTTDDFDVSLRESLRQGNMSLLVMDSNTSTLKVWSADERLMEERLYANIFGMTPVLTSGESGSLEKYDNGVQTDREDIYGEGLEEEYEENEDDETIDDPLYYAEFVITQILEEEQPYTINVVLDRRVRSRSIEMISPGVPIDSPVVLKAREQGKYMIGELELAAQFAAGTLLAVTGTFLAVWLSRRITEPLRQLTDISVRMKELDFSAKYDGKNHTELDILGSNMNELSQKLEETISALRTANNDLQRDLDRRNRQEEMRQEFLSNVTHELKTPIALIRGYAEGLQDGIADDPESRSFYLDTIVEESDKMNVIVQKVLQLNQLEFGDNTVAMERFDIVDMIRNYLDSASILARQENIKLQFDRRSPLYVWGDPFMIQEVFQNYYSNALHHAEPRSQSGSEPEKVIDIRCDVTDSKARITVFNTGRPIPEESLPHIWEKFYKVDKARTRAYGGSGVGLSIVKAIMQLHHQAYGAENYDNGVAFWFELDTQAAQASPAAAASGPAQDTQAAQASLSTQNAQASLAAQASPASGTADAPGDRETQ